MSDGRVISNSMCDPTSSSASAWIYTPAALTFWVVPEVWSADSPSRMVIGRLRGNLLPVLASDKLYLLLAPLNSRANYQRSGVGQFGLYHDLHNFQHE